MVTTPLQVNKGCLQRSRKENPRVGATMKRNTCSRYQLFIDTQNYEKEPVQAGLSAGKQKGNLCGKIGHHHKTGEPSQNWKTWAYSATLFLVPKH
jgi:hypothetical protein